jgi:protein arginine kinase activator
MLCSRCGKNVATVHVKQVINGEVSEEHLCEACAGNSFSFGTWDLNKVFSGGFTGMRGATCPNCGMALSEFNSTGRLGCSKCYEAFSEQLSPVIDKFHGVKRHRGKIKLRRIGQNSDIFLQNPDLANKNYERLALQKQLSELVELEKFEDAAAVRDKIKALDAEINGALNGKSGIGKNGIGKEGEQL